MKAIYIFLFVFLGFGIASSKADTGKTVHGVVKDSTGLTVIGATVKLKAGTDSISTATDANGAFTFNNVTSATFDLTFSSIGFQSLKRHLITANDVQPVNLGVITLKFESHMLKGVTISDINPVKLKEDTVEFKADAYKVRDNAPVEDVLKKLPGVDIDKDGNMTAQGKSVTKVRVNGKDFFGGDLKTATKNLPADIVENIQIIDDYGDQANITGIKTGEPEKVLNITVKPNKNYGYFGQATVGDGADAIPQEKDNRYVASATAFSFSGNRQLAFLGNLNNTNTNLFSFGGGGPRSGGPGGPPPGAGGSSNTNGITTARSIGLNYRDQWGKKVTVYGSYSFSDNTTNTISSTIQNNTSLTNPLINNVSSNQTDEKINHRFNFNLEYKPDTVNYIKFVPSISYAGVNTDQSASSLFSQNNQTVSNYNLLSTLNSSAPNYGANLLYNHRFNSKGRNFSVNVSAGSARIDQTQNPVYTYLAGTATAPLNQLINTNVRTDTVGTSLSYMEPLGKGSYLELNYAYHHGYTTSDKETDTLTSLNNRNRYDLLSNSYNYTFVTNRFGLNYRFIQKKYNYTLGIAAQPATLDGNSLTTGEQTHVTTFNIAPTARFIYNFSRSQSLSLNYNGASNQPTYNELQPVTDFSNASYPVQGNANLKPEFNNNLTLRYNQFNFASGNILFTNLTFTKTDNKIVANTISYPSVYTPNPKLAGTILTQYLNADGFYSGNANYVFAKPWQKRKYNLFLTGNIAYNNNISYISNVAADSYDMTTEKNIAKNMVITQGAKFRLDITDVVDAELSTSYSINHTDNSISSANVNNNFRTINLGLNGKNYFFKDYTLSYDYSKVIYKGYTGATNPNILNVYAERRFLKNNIGTLRLSAFDLFNQNTGYTSSGTGTYTTQTQANRLGRYYLLSFTLKLQKFAGKRPEGPPGGGPPPGGGFGGPPPGGE
ncbi:TonB-dependent receptor [Mucilaginibacter agri]|uniref:Outer membrane beta-barrel protein n=1 Tax=Mucilaginibacter agri TaxID=2695265 RepID=A0A965ZIQ1_9SPHI|nr:TonB-dependent receptor [Mucilaginibacter agri]NCD70812.1 outer membrane beta-barrel protein [Mucilaginibacter agri]